MKTVQELENVFMKTYEVSLGKSKWYNLSDGLIYTAKVEENGSICNNGKSKMLLDLDRSKLICFDLNSLMLESLLHMVMYRV